MFKSNIKTLLSNNIKNIPVMVSNQHSLMNVFINFLHIVIKV